VPVLRRQRHQYRGTADAKWRSPTVGGTAINIILRVHFTALMRRTAAGLDPVAHVILLLHLPPVQQQLCIKRAKQPEESKSSTLELRGNDLRMELCRFATSDFVGQAVALRGLPGFGMMLETGFDGQRGRRRDTMKNGLYSIHVSLQDGRIGKGSGVVVFRDGKIVGGDAYLYYIGTYTVKDDNTFKGEVLVQRQTSSPDAHPLFGAPNPVGIGVSGTFTDTSAVMNGTALVGKASQIFGATLRKLADID
jgi:hypothetical protein